MKRVLIIEDDHSIGEVEKEYFELSGYKVDLYNNGRVGYIAALENSYDLIILDIMLPGMNGFEIAKELREKFDIPIIMVTAKDSEFDKLKGFGLRIDDYITKPFSASELVARAKAHLARYDHLSKKTSSESSIEIRGLVIYPEKRQVFVDGKELDLTKKEFELVYLLASTPNKIFTKDEIFKKVWGYDSDQGIGTIAVHIRNLREKMEANPAKPEYVQTVWGFGYKMPA